MSKPFIEDAIEKLMRCAKKEFIKKGYQDASVRLIASDAGVSTFTIYARFKDKAGLYSAVVRPAAEKYANTFASEMDLFNDICPNATYDEMTQYMLGRLPVLVDVIYDDFERFYLLAMNTENVEYENFIHSLAEIQARQSIQYLNSMENDTLTYTHITPELFHLTYTAQFSGIFEIVRHNMGKEQGLQYFSQLQLFFFAGYKALMGFHS